jgi:uncharacterized OB-fold protein
MPSTPPDAATIGMRVQATFRPAGNDLGFVDFAVAP